MSVQMISSNMKISNVSANSKQQYEDKDNHKSKKNEILSKERKQKQVVVVVALVVVILSLFSVIAIKIYNIYYA